jgi:formate dehydrogenase
MADGAPRQYAAFPPVGVLRRRVRHRDRRVHLDQPTMAAEVDRLIAQPHESAPGFPLRLFTIRELRSHNSWLHNIPKLMSAGRSHRLRINPNDADDRGIATGSKVVVRSPWGQVTTLADVTDEVVAGSVGMPASWGHAGGWRRAVQAGGGNYNELAPNDPAMVDRVSGNAFLNGIDVEVTPVTDLYPAELS